MMTLRVRTTERRRCGQTHAEGAACGRIASMRSRNALPEAQPAPQRHAAPHDVVDRTAERRSPGRQGCRPAAPASLAWKIGSSGACPHGPFSAGVLRSAGRGSLQYPRWIEGQWRIGASTDRTRLRARFTFFALTPLKVARGPASLPPAGERTPRPHPQRHCPAPSAQVVRTLCVSARALTGSSGMQVRGSRFAGVENRVLRRLSSRSVLGWGSPRGGRGSLRYPRWIGGPVANRCLERSAPPPGPDFTSFALTPLKVARGPASLPPAGERTPRPHPLRQCPAPSAQVVRTFCVSARTLCVSVRTLSASVSGNSGK